MRAAAALLVLLAACRPDLGEPTSLVTRPRVLAILADPPEAAPGEAVTLRALVVDPGGTADVSPTWSLCLEPKAVSENNVVSTGCVFDPEVPVGTGREAVALVPQDACARFGPDTPPTIPGEPPLRPRDPDITGGYYQPLRAALEAGDAGALVAVGLVRITCNLPSAPLAVIQDYRARYRANANPAIAVLGTVDASGAVAPIPARVARGQELALVLGWPPESAETFPVLDLRSRVLVDVRESLRASWFTTAGAFEADRTGRVSGDLARSTENRWTAPDTAGPVHLWVVLRDSRGGASAATADLDVE